MKNLAGRPFAMLGVNVLPHSPAELKEVMATHQLNWRNFADDGSIAEHWNTPATPSFYIIDQQGIIRHKWIGHPGEMTLEAALEDAIQARSASK